MSIYRLKCLPRFQDGHTGYVLDARVIEAGSADDAICQAKLYECVNPDLTLVSLALSVLSGAVIWSLQSQANWNDSDRACWSPTRV